MQTLVNAGINVDLSILIVNWNSAYYLKPCLASVYREINDIEFEVLVVDNASYDGSAELMKNEFPQATFIQSRNNLGFIRGNNLLFQHAKGRNILLLNPDTEIVGNAIQRMLGHLESLPQAGAIGCRLLNGDGSVQPSLHTFPTILNQLLDSEALRRRFPRSSLWNMQPLYDDTAAPVIVDAVGGACLMVKAPLFREIGMLSDDYVMYADDLDLAAKLKQAGYKVYFTTQCSVIHYGARSTESLQEGLSEVWMRDSFYRFFCKFRGQAYGALYKATMAGVATARLLLLGLMRLASGETSRSDRLRLASARWKRTLQWSVGAKRWAQRAAEQMNYVAKQL
jgi:GT2 family glycosyltransferase